MPLYVESFLLHILFNVDMIAVFVQNMKHG
jgi:nicotinamide riboside transporter PnuC